MNHLKRFEVSGLWKRYSRIEWFAAAFGILCILFVLTSLFTSLRDNTPQPTTNASISFADMPVFDASIANAVNTSVEDGTPITILTNGKEFLPDLLTEIQNAHHSIYITDYIWDNGTFGNTVFDALIAKAREGVQVRVLLDGVSGKHANKRKIKELTDAGGRVARFRPISWWNADRLNRRTHARDFVIDSTTAYLGGIAISDAWLGDATSSTSWHDYMYKVHGDMALRSNKVFTNLWDQTTGETLAVTQGATTSSIAPTSKFVSLFSTPAPDMSSNLQHFFWLSILAAHKSIHIENPYLLPSKPLAELLMQKAREGVDVKLVIPGTHTDTLYTRWASQSYYTQLLNAGVKIYEYQPSRLHAKNMTMDGVWSIIGSANLDNRSSQINLEYIMGVDDPVFAQALEKNFAADRAKSHEVTKDEWSHHSIFYFPLDYIARLFAHQY